MFDFSSAGNMFGNGGLTNLFGGEGGSSSNLFSSFGSNNGSISLPGMDGANSNETSFEAKTPDMLSKLGESFGDYSTSAVQHSAAGSPNGKGEPIHGTDEATSQHARVANALAAERAQDEKMDKYTRQIPFAGTFVTLGRQNDRKIGALLSSYYMMTTPKGSPGANSTQVIDPLPGAGYSSFLGGY